jgi:hypothetical protein
LKLVTEYHEKAGQHATMEKVKEPIDDAIW